MLDKINFLLKDKPLVVSRFLFLNYKKFNITDSEFILVLYLLNMNDNVFNPKLISSELSITIPDIMNMVTSLSSKGMLKLDVIKGSRHTEVIDLEPLYQKLSFSFINVEEAEDTSMYSIFESEFGRTLSSMEYEIINAWIDAEFSEELIIMALKEAIYNGVTNLRYIDKILHEWKKKGIRSKDDVEKNRKSFKEKKEVKAEVFDYDWLNDEE